jgi:hypothetical protein
VNADARRAIDLRGELEAVDQYGHRVRIACHGERIVVGFTGGAAALAAARSARSLHAEGLRWLFGTLMRHAPFDPADLAVELRIGARCVGRAGGGAAPNWLGRVCGAPGTELRPLALLVALLDPRN